MQLRGSLMPKFYAGFAFERRTTWALKAGGVLGRSLSIYPLWLHLLTQVSSSAVVLIAGQGCGLLKPRPNRDAGDSLSWINRNVIRDVNPCVNTLESKVTLVWKWITLKPRRELPIWRTIHARVSDNSTFKARWYSAYCFHLMLFTGTAWRAH